MKPLTPMQELTARLQRERQAKLDAYYDAEKPMAPLPPDGWPVEFIPNEGVCGCNVRRLGPCAACVQIEQLEQQKARKGP